MGAQRGDAFLQLLLSTCCFLMSLQVSLHEQAQKPIISSSCAVVLQLRSWLILLCPAEYISAGLHVLYSCSTGAADLGAVFEYVHIYALSLTCLCLQPFCQSVFLS